MQTNADVVKALGKNMMTEKELDSKFPCALSSRVFGARINDGAISRFPDPASGGYIYYRQAEGNNTFLSERQLTAHLQDTIQKMSFEQMVLFFLKHSTDFYDLYDFLSQFDLKKNGKPWINEFILTQTMDKLLRDGSLEDILTPAEKAIMAASQLGLVTEEHIMTLGAYIPTQEEHETVRWRIRPVDWHLLVKTGDNPVIYQSAYCMKISNELQSLGISLQDLADPEKVSNNGKIDTLLRFGLINKNKKLNELGKQQIEFMSKCSFDFENKTTLENYHTIADYWHRKALDDFDVIAASADDLNQIKPIENANAYEKTDLIQKLDEIGKSYYGIKKRHTIAAKQFVDSALRAFSAKRNFIEKYEEKLSESGLDISGKCDLHQKVYSGKLQANIKKTAFSYWNLKEEDLISCQDFNEKRSIYAVNPQEIEKYTLHIRNLLNKNRKLDKNLLDDVNNLQCADKNALVNELFRRIGDNEKLEAQSLLAKIAGSLKYTLEPHPTREEYYYFKSILGKHIGYFEHVRIGEAASSDICNQLMFYARGRYVKDADDKPLQIENLPGTQFEELMNKLSKGYVLRWDVKTGKEIVDEPAKG